MPYNGFVDSLQKSFVAANVTNATTTLAAITGLSATVVSGRKYIFQINVMCVDSLAADGVKFAIDGGTAAMTNVRMDAEGLDTALEISAQTTALATTVSAATFTGDGLVMFRGSLEPSSSGTFIPRFAQVAHTTGTMTVYRGSHMLVWDVT